MSLFDRLRPDWKHSDADVRADAVRQLGPQSKETLSEIARTDDDSKVRQLAIKKLEEPDLLRQVAAEQGDAKLARLARDRANALLAERVASGDEESARQALAAIDDDEHLAKVALGDASSELRHAAVERLGQPAALLHVLRESHDPQLQVAAVGRLEASDDLLSVALHHEHGEVGLAALERLDAPARLAEVAERAAVKAVRERAAERLDALPANEQPHRAGDENAEEASAAAMASPPAPADGVSDESGAAAEEPSDDQPADEEPLTPPSTPEELRRQREVLCATVEAMRGEVMPDDLRRAQRAWESLESSAGPARDDLRERFERAVAAAETRHQEQRSEHRRAAELAEVCQRAETLAGVESYKGFERKWRKIQERWQQLTGEQAAPEEVAQRYAAAAAAVETRRGQEADRQVQRRNDNLARLKGLTERVEALAEAEELNLKKAQQAQREAQLAVRQPGPLPPGEVEATWPGLKQRLDKGLEALAPRVAQIEQEEDWKRWANVPLQEELCAKMEALIEHEDLAHVAREMRSLSAEWRTVASAPPEKSEELWQRFRDARDKVRERTKDFFDEQKKARQENLEKKRALCEKVEAIADSTDWRQTAEEIKALQAEWKSIGPVPRKHSDTVWKRFRKSCDQFFERRKAFYDELHQQRMANLEQKRALCEKVEAIAESTDWEQTTNQIKGYQAQWKAIGPVPRKHSDAVWNRFRKACDLFFDRRGRKHEIGREDNLKKRREILAELEALLPSKPEPKQPEAKTSESKKTQQKAGAERATSEPEYVQTQPTESDVEPRAEAPATAAPTPEQAAAPEPDHGASAPVHGASGDEDAAHVVDPRAENAPAVETPEPSNADGDAETKAEGEDARAQDDQKAEAQTGAASADEGSAEAGAEQAESGDAAQSPADETSGDSEPAQDEPEYVQTQPTESDVEPRAEAPATAAPTPEQAAAPEPDHGASAPVHGASGDEDAAHVVDPAAENAPAVETPEARPEEAAEPGTAEPVVPEDLAERIQRLRAEWKNAGDVPERDGAKVEKRWLEVTDRLVEAYGGQLEGTDLDPEVNHRKREQLVRQLEKLVAKTRDEQAEQQQEPTLQDLASQLKQALAANTIRGAGSHGAEDAWQRTEKQRQRLEESWRRIPGKPEGEVAERYVAARKELAALAPKGA